MFLCTFATGFLSVFGLTFAPYLVWMIYDNVVVKTYWKGARLDMKERRKNIYQRMAGYFPVTLHKTVDLDPEKHYVFGVHPHGAGGFSLGINFATEATGFSEKFPGIVVRPVALNLNCWFPWGRDVCQRLGVIAADESSIDYALSHYGPSSSVAIAVGGVAEQLDAVPNTLELTIRRRKGFVRLAIKHGASLVPVISFGENDSYTQKRHPDDSKYRNFQVWFYNKFKVALQSPKGEGWHGMKPHKIPINTVVGRPIVTVKNPVPSQEEIDRVHLQYLNALETLFEENKNKYADPSLQLVLK